MQRLRHRGSAMVLLGAITFSLLTGPAPAGAEDPDPLTTASLLAMSPNDGVVVVSFFDRPDRAIVRLLDAATGHALPLDLPTGDQLDGRVLAFASDDSTPLGRFVPVSWRYSPLTTSLTVRSTDGTSFTGTRAVAFAAPPLGRPQALGFYNPLKHSAPLDFLDPVPYPPSVGVPGVPGVGDPIGDASSLITDLLPPLPAARLAVAASDRHVVLARPIDARRYHLQVLDAETLSVVPLDLPLETQVDGPVEVRFFDLATGSEGERLSVSWRYSALTRTVTIRLPIGETPRTGALAMVVPPLGYPDECSMLASLTPALDACDGAAFGFVNPLKVNDPRDELDAIPARVDIP